MSLIGEPLRAAIARRLTANVMAAFQPGIDLRLAAFGIDAVILGAIGLAQHHSGRQ